MTPANALARILTLTLVQLLHNMLIKWKWLAIRAGDPPNLGTNFVFDGRTVPVGNIARSASGQI